MTRKQSDLNCLLCGLGRKVKEAKKAYRLT